MMYLKNSIVPFIAFFFFIFISVPRIYAASPVNPVSPAWYSFGVPAILSGKGPEKDIVERALTANKASAEVDEPIDFSVTIQNRAPFTKVLKALCFESTDGNLGCVTGIVLPSEQTTTIKNTSSWTSGGTKTVWVTWSQNDVNYYRPINSKTATVSIQG